MPKKLTPYEKVDNFITKNYDLEIDKWNAGLSNNMEEWENFITYWNLIEHVTSLRKDNAELRMYNEKLKDDNSRLSYQYQKLKEDYDNANPSEALVSLQEIKNYIEDNITTKHNHVEPQIEIVKKALLKQLSGSQYTNIYIDEAEKKEF